MGLPHSDVINLLYPQGCQREREQARRWVTHLRLLQADGSAGSTPSVGVGRVHARRELEWVLRRQLQEAIEALLQHGLGTLLSVDSCAGFGLPALAHQEAWSRLEFFRSRGWSVPHIPEPGEDILASAARIVDGAQVLELPADRILLWRSRLERLQGASVGSPPWKFPHGQAAMEFAADQAGHLLDRGRVREALEGLREFEQLAGGLAGRARLLIEWAETILDAGSGHPAWDGEQVCEGNLPPEWSAGERKRGIQEGLPAPLLELREQWPQTLPHLRGSALEQRTSIPLSSPLPSRSELGAGVLMRLGFDGGGTHIIEAQVPPGLRRSVPDWHLGRDRSWRDPGAPEHELLLAGRAVLRRSGAGELAPEGALDPASRALALVPIPSPEEGQECAGWIQIEYRHVFLPARARLESWGRALVVGPARACDSRTTDAPDLSVQAPEDPAPWREGGRLFEEVLARVGTRLGRRRWWGFLVGAEGILPVGSGGQGLQTSVAGEGRALERALRTGGVARFDAPDPALAQAREAGSGVVIPARLRGRVVALLALESDRRKAFRERDVQRVERALQGRALALRLAAFRAWHLEQYGSDLAFAAGERGFGQLADHLWTAARAQTPVLVSGPPGAGKRVLMRWMQFEWALEGGASEGGHAPRARAPLGSVEAPSAQQVLAALEQPCALFEGLDRWPVPVQRQLAQALEHAPRTKVLLHVQGRLETLAQDGALDPRLVRVLANFELHVAGLAERRGELPYLVNGLLRILRQSHGGPLLRLDDQALGLFWRQPWDGGLGALKGSLLKLLLEAPGEEIGVDLAWKILSAYGAKPLKRLPSRRPRRRDVESALESTRMESGRINKTRAAQYLGWDPDTLVARMGDLGITPADRSSLKPA
jgi:putative methionine-R-sulfoxide reductase with GAF domain